MMINRVSRKDPRFLPNPSGLCPCGGGKILAQCCRRFDGVVFKEPSAIRPPGLLTGYSHPRCYLGFTQNCCTKISGEHFVSQGILRQIGQSVSITGAPWLKIAGRLTRPRHCRRGAKNTAFVRKPLSLLDFLQSAVEVRSKTIPVIAEDADRFFRDIPPEARIPITGTQ